MPRQPCTTPWHKKEGVEGRREEGRGGDGAWKCEVGSINFDGETSWKMRRDFREVIVCEGARSGR